jgi:hypothetical protein
MLGTMAKTKGTPRRRDKPPEAPSDPVPTVQKPLIDLSAELQVGPADMPAIERTPDGQPIVAWARIGVISGRDSAPKSWVARLGADGARLTRSFVDRAASRKTGYTVVNDDPFIMESYFTQDHPLVAATYEASSTFTGGPEGYEGRAAFDVQPDGTIEVVAVGPRDRPFSRDIQADLVRRVRRHDEGGRVDRDRAEREAEASVRSDALIERYGFPDLEGSEKQVRWAMDIRRKAFDELSRNSGNPQMWVAVVREQTSAKWWIDNRAQVTSRLVQLRVRAGRPE